MSTTEPEKEASVLVKIPITVEVPIGPQHPALHEPVLLKVYADGEEVTYVDVVTGYNHRGIEKLLESSTFHKGKFIASRVCGICNTIHDDCYTRALEYLAGIEPPPRARYLRVLAMELERIHSHMLVNAVMADIVGFDALFMLIMKDREQVMKAKEILTGNRVLADYMVLGGVRRDLDEFKRGRLLTILEKVEERIRYYRKLFEEDSTINSRLRGVGVIKAVEAVAHGLLGPTLRASNVKYDARADERYDAYDEVPFNVITAAEGDALARALVRWDEALESVSMCKYVLEHLPSGPAVVDERRLPRTFPAGEAYARAEAPRGELTYFIASVGGAVPYRVKIRTPSLNNVVNSAFSYVGYSLADVPVILTSYDPCVSCMERAIVIDLKEGREFTVPLKDLALRGAKTLMKR